MATIVVAGGGLAGLACAWRLRRAGHDVRVLECGSRVGGRARTERRGGFVLDVGCPVVTRGQRRVLALARETGLLGSLRPWPSGRDACWREGRLVGAAPADALRLFGALHRDPAARTALRAVAGLHRPTRAFDPSARVSPERVLRDAAVDALCWWPCAEGADDRHGVALRAALPLAAPHAFAGGMGALVEALARGLDVVTGCEVLRVESDASEAVVTLREGGPGGRERSERADAAVVAVPAPRVSGLCPKLAPAERDFFEGARFGSGIVVALLFERAARLAWRSVVFPPESGLEVASLVSLPAGRGGAAHGAGALRAALTSSAAARMHRMPDASIADLVLENLAYSPVGPLRPDAFAVFRHPHLAPRFDPEHAGRLARFASRLERSPRLSFAGDALAGRGSDAAVASGLRAAAEITALV